MERQTVPSVFHLRRRAKQMEGKKAFGCIQVVASCSSYVILQPLANNSEIIFYIHHHPKLLEGIFNTQLLSSHLAFRIWQVSIADDSDMYFGLSCVASLYIFVSVWFIFCKVVIVKFLFQWLAVNWMKRTS